MVSFLDFQRKIETAPPRATPCETAANAKEQNAVNANVVNANADEDAKAKAKADAEAEADEDCLFQDEISLAGASIPDESESLSILSVICEKTGRVLGELNLPDEDDAEETTDFLSAKRLCMPCRGVSTEWLETKPDNLDRLMIADPRGYAVYCLAFLAAAMRRNSTAGEAKAMMRMRFVAMPDDPASLWALARAAKWSECFEREGDENLTALNETLCRGLSILPSFSRAIRYIVTSQRFRKFRERQFRTSVVLSDLFAPDFLMRRAAEGSLQPLLTKALSDAIAGTLVIRAAIKHGRDFGEDRAKTPADAARGPSQIKGQRVSKRTIEYAQDFARLFSEYGISETLFAPNNQLKQEAKASLAQAAEQKREARAFNNFGNAFRAAAPQNGAELADGPEVMSDEDLLMTALDDLSIDDLPEASEAFGSDDDQEEQAPKASAFSFDGLLDGLLPTRETDETSVEVRRGSTSFRKL